MKTLLLLFFLILSNVVSGQPEKIYFQSLRKGLSNQFVRCILKDSKGFMWFGTQNGLTRYDGVNFVVYENSPEDTTSLCYNNISAIFEDKSNNLWVSTFLGLNLYNREMDNFVQISAFQGVVITSICEDNDSILWIGTVGKGLISYDRINKRATFYGRNTDEISDVNILNSNHVTGVLIDTRNRLWVATWNGLYLMDTKGKIIRHYLKEQGNPHSLSDNYVNTMSLENDSVLWIGTLYGGLHKLTFDNERTTFKLYLGKSTNFTPPSILSMMMDKYNHLWIGIENWGLLRLNTTSEQIDHYVENNGNFHSLNSNLIRSLYIDDLDILWIGTIGRGVNYVDGRYKRFEIYKKDPENSNSLCGDDVRSFAEDKQGNIWVATYDGICMFDPQKQQFIKKLTRENSGLTSDAVNSMVFDAEGNLWIGTLNQGIDCFNKNHQKIGNYKIRGIQKVGENKINILYVDKKNDLWAGTSGSGLFKYDKSKKTFIQIYNESDAVGAKQIGYVFSILETSDHKIWVTTAYRLFCLEEEGNNKYKFSIFASNNSHGSIKSNNTVTLFEDKQKNLWVGSIDQGLFLFNKKSNSFISYTTKDGLPGNTILGILEDNQGNLWISTTKGIARFHVSTKKFTNYKAEDGLVSDEFNTNSCVKSKNGMLFFGSGEGFIGFYPERIKSNTSVQPVCLTDFRLFNQPVQIGVKGSPLAKSIGETRKVVLKYKQSSFSIEFVALNYIQGSKSQYAYILEGLEDNWNTVANMNSATYSYVKPGKYVFKVKGSNNDGIWNNIPATLEIVVLPPWWNSKLAFALYLLICIGIIYAIIQYRVAIAKQIHLAELNQMKLQFFANISHELRTPLSLIISPVENLVAYAANHAEIKEKLELIYKNANRLYRLVNEIMDFSRSVEYKLTITVQKGDIVKFSRELSYYFQDEALRRQITYRFEANPENIVTWFDPDKFEKVILNLLSNAFKFTPDHGTISLKIEKLSLDSLPLAEIEALVPKVPASELLKISIIDNGKGIIPADLDRIFDRFYQGNSEDYIYQSGTGIGLSLAKSLVELHHGKIFAASEQGKETCFTILMPLGNHHFQKSEIKMEPVEISSKLNDLQLSGNETTDNEIKTPQHAPTILLVEDNFELRKYIVSSLSDKYNTIEAGDGETGYKLAVEHVPDLIISDIIMPVLSGIDFCKQIKGNIVTSHIPFILLTAKITLEDKIYGIETGADAYITKPFNVKYLEAVIKNLIQSRKKLFQRFRQEINILPREMSNNQLDQHFLERIIQYVDGNITKTELSVEELAAYLLMSPGHIWRKVKSLTGLPTNEFIRTIKLKKAIKIMEERNLSISEIAYQVGFSSPAYFTKCFKEQYGKSPSSFLNNKRINKN